MSNQLSLEKRVATGKQLKALRAEGQIPSVVYGGEAPVLTTSSYNITEKVLNEAGYHSPIQLDLNGKAQLAIVKNIDVDPVSRRIINVEFIPFLPMKLSKRLLQSRLSTSNPLKPRRSTTSSFRSWKMLKLRLSRPTFLRKLSSTARNSPSLMIS